MAMHPSGVTFLGGRSTKNISADTGEEPTIFWVVLVDIVLWGDPPGRPPNCLARACLILAWPRDYDGAMVEAIIRGVSPDVPVKLVNAGRGKAIRAEPVVALYEQGRIHHVGSFVMLEDQMTQWSPGVGRSPDHAGAAVWAATELMVEKQQMPARWGYVPFMGR